ncbi:hypothetical protein D3C85_1544600 [compost metagenome]
MREIDSKVVPSLIGDIVALEVQGLGVAVRNLHHTAALTQCFGPTLFVRQLLIFMPLRRV